MEKIKAYCVAPLDNVAADDVDLGIGGGGERKIINRRRSKSESAAETRRVS